MSAGDIRGKEGGETRKIYDDNKKARNVIQKLLQIVFSIGCQHYPLDAVVEKNLSGVKLLFVL